MAPLERRNLNAPRVGDTRARGAGCTRRGVGARWEYFADGPNAEHFAESIEAPEQLVVPTLSLYEVFKHTLQQVDEGAALQAVVVMQQGTVIELDQSLALRAALLSEQLKLPMADSVILATARRYEATLWTQSSDFEHIDGVRYFPKK